MRCLRLLLPILVLVVVATIGSYGIAEDKAADAAAPVTKELPAKELFDGKSLEGWKATDFGNQGKVVVRDKTIVMERGNDMTGITFSGKPPRNNYELTLEGKRIEGSDFFCTTTFPVGDDYCSFVTGGWGGSIVGLSNVDHMDASENQTSTTHDFKKNTWYRFRIRVTDDKIAVWIDNDQVVNQNRKEYSFGIRIECDASRPLGISSWCTTGAVRNIRLRELK